MSRRSIVRVLKRVFISLVVLSLVVVVGAVDTVDNPRFRRSGLLGGWG